MTQYHNLGYKFDMCNKSGILKTFYIKLNKYFEW